METAVFRGIIWSQLAASLEMVENAITNCSVLLWSNRSRTPQYWFLVYHTLFFVDLYASKSAKDFAPPAPFTASGLHSDIDKHERIYSREEMVAYLDHGRKKAKARIDELDEKGLLEPCNFAWVGVTNAELVLYNMRHVQHHTAQLNQIVRQELSKGLPWVFKGSR